MINILFGGNSKVFDGILLSLISITKHCPDSLNVFVLTADVTEINEDYKPLTENHIKILEKILKNKNKLSKISLIKLSFEFNNWICSSQNKLNSYTPFAFLRLFADKVNNLPEKIIYLDTDILLNGNIKELFNTDITNFEMAVVKDRYGRIFIHPNYFNSGMLLMNMKKIKETKLLEKVRDMCSKKKLAFPDQSALNKHCKLKLYLPRKYNEQGKLKKNTVLQHFSKRIKLLPYIRTINIKPWQIDQVKKIYKISAYNDRYDDYGDNSYYHDEYRDACLEKETPVVKKLVP